MVLSMIVAPAPKFQRPPPTNWAVLFLTVSLASVSVPSFSIPPPDEPVLSRITLFRTVSASLLKMPGAPPRIVRPLIVVGAKTSKTAPVLLASIVSVPAPGPRIVAASLIASKLNASVIVPLSEERSIVSAPALPAAQSPAVVSLFAFALLIASRNEHCPSVAASSVVVLTVIVVAAYAGSAPPAPNIPVSASTATAVTRNRAFFMPLPSHGLGRI
jgi:hypothetical protein